MAWRLERLYCDKLLEFREENYCQFKRVLVNGGNFSTHTSHLPQPRSRLQPQLNWGHFSDSDRRRFSLRVELTADSDLGTAGETGEIYWHQTSCFSQLCQEPKNYKIRSFSWSDPKRNETNLRIIKHGVFHDGDISIWLWSVKNDWSPPLWSPSWSSHFGSTLLLLFNSA